MCRISLILRVDVAAATARGGECQEDEMPDWAKIYYWFVYKDKASEWRWNFRAPNHKKLADSGEGYKNKSDCEAAIELIKRHGPTAPTGYPADK
jgi:uncharacterized protein YegP (UPF0339 family)